MASKFTVSTKFDAVDGVSSKVEKITKKTEKLGSTSEKAMVSIGNGLKKAGQIAGVTMGLVAGAGAGIYKITKDLSSYGNEIVKAAGVVGMSTKSLQEFRYIAERSGVPVEEMSKGIAKLSIDLANMSSTAQDSLAKMGLTSDDILQAGPEKSLELLSIGMQKLTDPADRAAIAMNLFGEGGVKIVNALNKGPEGLKKMADEANRVGYVLDENLLKKSETLNDAILNMETSIKALGRQFSASFMPIVIDVVNKITEFFIHIRPQFESFAGMLGGLVGTVLESINKALPAVLDLVTKLVTALTPILEALLPPIMQLVEKLVPIVGKLAVDIISALAPALESLGPIIGMIADVLVKTIQPIANALGPLLKKLEPIITKYIGLIMKLLGPFIEKLLPVFGELLGAALTALLPILDLVIIGLDKLTPLFNFLGSAIGAIADFISGIIKNVINPILVGLGQKAIQTTSAVIPQKTYSGNTGGIPQGAVPLSQKGTKSTIDVNFNNAPKGATVQRAGTPPPGINLRTGMAGSY